MLKACLFICGLSFLFSCESKMYEKSVDGYSDTQTAQQQLKIQNEFDTKMSSLQIKTNKVRDIIKQIQLLLQDKNLTALSFFDMLAEVNTVLENQMPTFHENNLSVVGEFSFKNSLLSEDCQKFDYKVTADSISPLQQIEYLIRSCQTKNDFLSILIVKFDEQKTALEFNQEALNQIFPIQSIQMKNSHCEFGDVSDDSQMQISCKNISFAQSENLIWFLDVNLLKKDLEIDVKALSKKTDDIIYQGQVKVSRDGKIDGINLNGPLSLED